MKGPRWMLLRHRAICAGGGERLEVGVRAFRDSSMRLTCCDNLAHAAEVGLDLDRRYRCEKVWAELAPRRVVRRVARRWRLDGRRFMLGGVATVAVLMVAHHPVDFTNAQAGAVTPTTVSGAPSPRQVGPSVTTGHVAADPGCFEDEAAVVAEDHDPSHGLTWICVPLDDLVEGSAG